MAVEETLDLKLSTTDGQKVARMVNEGVQRARIARQGMDDKIAGNWERYECRPPDRIKAYSQEPNLRAPLTLWVIDGGWVRIMRTIAGQLPYLRVNDEDLKNAPDSLPIQLVLQHLADTDLQLRFRWSNLFTNALVEGTAIGKIVRDTPTRRVRDQGSRLGLMNRIIHGNNLIERTVEDRGGLRFDVIDLKDFWVAHPGIVDLDQQPWVAHRVWLTWDELFARARDGRYTLTQSQLDTIKPLGKTRLRTSPSGALEQAKAVLDEAEDTGWPTVQEYEVIETAWRWDKDEDGKAVECLFSVLADWTDAPLRAQKYPFWNGKRNYVVYRHLPRANRFYGRSSASIVRPIQDEVDARLNQDLSATTIAVLAGLTPILPKSARREWERHRWNLLEAIFVDTPETFRTLASVIGNLRAIDPQLDRLFAMAERVSHFSDPQLAKPSEGAKTALEISTVISEGNISFAEMIEQLQLGNKELGFQVMEHAYQLALESPVFADRLARVAGTDPFAGISLSELRQRWQVVPVGNTLVANREAEARKWMGIFQLFKDDPFVQANPQHAWFLRNKVLQAVGVDREIEQIIGSEDMVKQFAQAQIDQQAAQGNLAAQVQQQQRLSRFGRTEPLGTSAVPGTIVPRGALPELPPQ